MKTIDKKPVNNMWKKKTILASVSIKGAQEDCKPGQIRVKTAVPKTFKKLGINSALSPNKGNVTDNNKKSLLGGQRTQKNRDFYKKLQ